MDAAARDRIVRQLLALYARCLTLKSAGNDVLAAKQGDGLTLITATPFEWRDPSTIPTRMQSVRTAGGGLEYAAWCIGDTVAAALGWDALHEIYDHFERQTDAKGSSWLNHRWSGVSDGKAVWAP